MPATIYLAHSFTQVENCDDAWNESTAVGVTSTADTGDKMEGTASADLVMTSAVSDGSILATEAITSMNLSAKTHILLWLKSTEALAAGDLQLLLDNTASCASPLETINIPATTANKWICHVLTLANPGSDTAIISIGIKMIADMPAFTINIDDVQACVARQFTSVLQAKGIDRPDNCENWPPQQEDLLDGSLFENIVGFRRQPIVDLLVKNNITDENFIHAWQRNATKRLVYNGDCVEVVLSDASAVIGAYAESEYATVWSLSLREKNLRTTNPPSWV